MIPFKDFNLLLEIAIKSALEAGYKILEIYNQDFNVTYKLDNSPLTIADIEANNIITSKLINTNIPIISEEGKYIENNNNYNKFWLVDPLDGTKEFINKNGEFTVNIALIENEIPILGVIYLPAKKELFYTNNDSSFYCKIESSTTHNISSIYRNSLKLICRKDNIIKAVVSRSHKNLESNIFFTIVR